MEIFGAILFSLFAGIASTLFSALLSILVYLCAHALVVRDASQTAALDRLLAESGWCSARSLGPSRLPACGVHFAFLRGPFIAVRSNEQHPRGGSEVRYTVYAVGSAAVAALQTRLMGDPRNVICVWTYAPMPWRTTSEVLRCAPPPVAYDWQARAVAELLRIYRKGGRASALVCGSPGTGKSSLGELLAVSIKQVLRREPEVIKNLDLTSKGLLISDVVGVPTPTSPIILMLDEFDTTVDYAENDDEKKNSQREGSALADTPTSLLAILDRLNRTPHMIIIATSNRKMRDMTCGRYARYTRRGRLDGRFTAERKDAP